MRNRIRELTLILMVCLAPWAFGSVEAVAEQSLYCAIGLLTVLGLGSRSGLRSAGPLLRLPTIALSGLVLLALFQATPLGSGVLSWIAPSAARVRANLVPDQPELVLHRPECAVPLPAATLALDSDASLQSAAPLAAAWLLFQCVLGMNDDPRAFARFANVFVINSVLLALFAMLQALTWNGSIYWVCPVMVSSAWSVGGPFLSHNHLAAYLNLGLGLALGLLLSGNSQDFLRRDSTKLWTAYAAAIIALGVVTSHSRSGFLGLLAASLVLALLLRGRLLQMGFGLAVVVGITALILTILSGSSSLGSRLNTILDLSDPGYQARFDVWRAAIRAWWAHPVWGSGLGTFPVAITPYLKRDFSVFFARAENEYVDILVEGGAVGFILVLCFVVGMIWLGRQALSNARGGHERGIVAGAGFGLVALAAQSVADFAPHIPAVGVTAVVFCALIARLGLQSSVDPPAPTGRRTSALAWIGSVLLAVLLIGHGIRDAEVENRLESVGVPLPGTLRATAGTMETSTLELNEWRDALQDAVARRPNWAEGYLRLGLVHLGLYRRTAKEWLERSVADPEEIDAMAEPLWLLGMVHDDEALKADGAGEADLLQFGPISNHLVPAIRCFLQARRCCPFLALPHAELASLQHLLARGDRATTYATRALVLSGNDNHLLAFLTAVAVETGDRKLAARCWRKRLEANPPNWPGIADEAAAVLSSEELLQDVAGDGRAAIHFADRLFGEADQREDRDRFYQAAIARLALDAKSPTLSGYLWRPMLQPAWG